MWMSGRDESMMVFYWLLCDVFAKNLNICRPFHRRIPGEQRGKQAKDENAPRRITDLHDLIPENLCVSEVQLFRTGK